MPRKQPRAYRKVRRYRYPQNNFRRMNGMMYDAAGVALGVGVLGAVVNTSMSMWGK